MGEYTELRMDVVLKSDTPLDVVDALLVMLRFDVGLVMPDHDHPLFRTPRWDRMFTCGSAYHPDAHGSKMDRDEFTGQLKLHVHSSFKHYNNEIPLFMDWIKPYLDPEEKVSLYVSDPI